MNISIEILAYNRGMLLLTSCTRISNELIVSNTWICNGLPVQIIIQRGITMKENKIN